MKIYVCGCIHGNWESLVNTVNNLITDGEEIDLILIAGDTMTMRNAEDLRSYSHYDDGKRLEMGSYNKICSGELKLPRLTLMIHGNNESADVLYHMPYGGWLAPNLYYLGLASKLIFGDIVISGISGIDFVKLYQTPFLQEYPIRGMNTRNWTKIRDFVDFLFYQISSSDICMSHDWPSGFAARFLPGTEIFVKRKLSQLVKDDKVKHVFGYKKGQMMLNKIKPKLWIASHHHFLFEKDLGETYFYACDYSYIENKGKIFEFLGEKGDLKISGEWISILKANEKFIKGEEKVIQNFEEGIKLLNYEKYEDIIIKPYDPAKVGIDQTIDFCRKFGIASPIKSIQEILDRD